MPAAAALVLLMFAELAAVPSDNDETGPASSSVAAFVTVTVTADEINALPPALMRRSVPPLTIVPCPAFNASRGSDR